MAEPREETGSDYKCRLKGMGIGTDYRIVHHFTSLYSRYKQAETHRQGEIGSHPRNGSLSENKLAEGRAGGMPVCLYIFYSPWLSDLIIALSAWVDFFFFN